MSLADIENEKFEENWDYGPIDKYITYANQHHYELNFDLFDYVVRGYGCFVTLMLTFQIIFIYYYLLSMGQIRSYRDENFHEDYGQNPLDMELRNKNDDLESIKGADDVDEMLVDAVEGGFEEEEPAKSPRKEKKNKTPVSKSKTEDGHHSGKILPKLTRLQLLRRKLSANKPSTRIDRTMMSSPTGMASTQEQNNNTTTNTFAQQSEKAMPRAPKGFHANELDKMEHFLNHLSEEEGIP